MYAGRDYLCLCLCCADEQFGQMMRVMGQVMCHAKGHRFGCEQCLSWLPRGRDDSQCAMPFGCCQPPPPGKQVVQDTRQKITVIPSFLNLI